MLCRAKELLPCLLHRRLGAVLVLALALLVARLGAAPLGHTRLGLEPHSLVFCRGRREHGAANSRRRTRTRTSIRASGCRARIGRRAPSGMCAYPSSCTPERRVGSRTCCKGIVPATAFLVLFCETRAWRTPPTSAPPAARPNRTGCRIIQGSRRERQASKFVQTDVHSEVGLGFERGSRRESTRRGRRGRRPCPEAASVIRIRRGTVTWRPSHARAAHTAVPLGYPSHRLYGSDGRGTVIGWCLDR